MQAKEAEGDFESAVEAYAKSGDVESCVRLLLDKLNQPHRAVSIVQETRSIEAAKLVARYANIKFYYKIIIYKHYIQY